MKISWVKKKPPNIYMTNQQMFYSCPLNVGPPVCRLTKWIFLYALCSWAYFSSTSIRRHQAWFSSVNNTRHSKAHSNDSSKCRGLTASIAQQRKNKSQQNHRALELCRRDTFFCILRRVYEAKFVLSRVFFHSPMCECHIKKGHAKGGKLRGLTLINQY